MKHYLPVEQTQLVTSRRRGTQYASLIMRTAMGYTQSAVGHVVASVALERVCSYSSTWIPLCLLTRRCALVGGCVGVVYHTTVPYYRHIPWEWCSVTCECDTCPGCKQTRVLYPWYIPRGVLFAGTRYPSDPKYKDHLD